MIENAGYRTLIAAVIDRAFEDIKGAGPRCHRLDTDRAMAFILSDTCEAYCLELEISYEAIKEKAADLYRLELAKEQPVFRTRKATARGAGNFRRVLRHEPHALEGLRPG